jgi:hypothetical protein
MIWGTVTGIFGTITNSGTNIEWIKSPMLVFLNRWDLRAFWVGPERAEDILVPQSSRNLLQFEPAPRLLTSSIIPRIPTLVNET